MQDDRGPVGGDALGEAPHPRGDVGVVEEVKPFADHGLGHPVDDGEAEVVRLEQLAEDHVAFGGSALTIEDGFVGAQVDEPFEDRLTVHAQGSQPGDDAAFVVFVVEPEHPPAGLYHLRRSDEGGPALACFRFPHQPVDTAGVEQTNPIGAGQHVGCGQVVAIESRGQVDRRPRRGFGLVGGCLTVGAVEARDVHATLFRSFRAARAAALRSPSCSRTAQALNLV